MLVDSRSENHIYAQIYDSHVKLIRLHDDTFLTRDKDSYLNQILSK